MAYPRWRSHMVLAIAWSIFAGVPDDQPPAFGQPPSLDQLLGKEEKPTGGPPPAGPAPEQFNLLTPAVPPAPPPPPPDPGDVGNQKA